MASGPRLSPPALTPMRTFTGCPDLGGRGQRGNGAGDAVVVDVVVGDEAHRVGGDGVGEHAAVFEVRQQLVGCVVGEGHDVGPHRRRGRGRSRATAPPPQWPDVRPAA